MIFFFGGLSIDLTAIESIDITSILSLQDGEAVYTLPKIQSFVAHPKLNLAALIFAVKCFIKCMIVLVRLSPSLNIGYKTVTRLNQNLSEDKSHNRAAYTREGRKQLFTVLQTARGSTGFCPFILYH